MLELTHCECVLFDCAGLITGPETILEELAQSAAIGSLSSAQVVVFCVDVSKAEWVEDVAIRQLIAPEVVIAVAAKSDLLPEKILAERLGELKKLFGADFIAISSKTGAGLELLRDTIGRRMVGLTPGRGVGERAAMPITAEAEKGVALTARHRQSIAKAIDNISESAGELNRGNDEVAAMMMRTAYQSISDIEQEHIDEQVLERIFSRFCIGK